MTERLPPVNALVLYRGHPARVKVAADKLELDLEGGETQKVRPKDVILLHPGPLKSLAELRPQSGDIATAWEMLAGATTTLPELAELIYAAFTPPTAWAAWQLVADGLYFRGAGPDEIIAATPEEVAHTQAARAADVAEKQAWSAFLARVRAGRVVTEDERYVRDVEALALGRTARSRVLRELGREEASEVAHQTLLDLGVWTPDVNPYPTRLGVTTSQPDLPLPPLPDEPRRDLTHLPAFAIDDAATETPDDAVSLDGGRLWVHVADPATIVPPDSPIDLEARARGASLYLPEGTINMLPPAATPLLALGLSEISPALSFGIDVTDAGEIAGIEIAPSWVRVTRLTYEAAAARLNEEPFASLYRLALTCRDRREAAGAFTLELPEVDVRVDPPLRSGPTGFEALAGQVDDARNRLKPLVQQNEQPSSAQGAEVRCVSIIRVPPLLSRVLVENAMILAGEATARYAIERDIPMPFSTQDPSDSDERPDGSSLAAAYAFRRTLKRSQYRSTPSPHSGLGLDAYTQSTSPMRRYLDLVAHQQLRAYLRGEPVLNAEQILERVGATEAVIGSLRQAERFSDQHWTLVYLLQHPKWQGEGIVVEHRERNSIVLIPALGLEPSLRLSGDPSLNSAVRLAVSHVDLPRLDARFKA
ncbi:MAG: RNB domain-containing ribonuclease [Chloroflexi bacterium]|nr:RNB domain-containing ribonuclease [Chloroflexota bacterium]